MAEPPGPWIKYTGNPVVVTGTVGSWDADSVADPTVISDGVTYKMWYGGEAGGIYSIGYATSTSGITWTKYAGNPVITGTAGSWDANVVGSGDVVFDGATYRMWYWGADSMGGTYGIGYATSTNGTTWAKSASNPVITGTVGSGDASMVLCPCVISDTGLYKMWYTGVDDGGTWSIGYAISTDGISWTKYAGNPVLDREGRPGNWEGRVMHPGVLLEGDIYKMWYTGDYKQIGYASPGSYTTPGYLIFHEADATIVYNWFTYIPRTIIKTEHNYILLCGVHSAVLTNDYDETTQKSRKMAHRGWARRHKYIVLVPVIPRPTIPEYMCVPAFSWHVFLDSVDPFYQRPDFKVNLMIDKLVSDLRNEGYHVDEKVFVEGFSAGGMFAQRYALLHPERVQAIAAGQCGGAMTLAESTYDGTQMDWPVGVNDFSSLAGYEFNQSAYQQVPQFISVGEQDTHTTLYGPGDLWRTQSQIDFLKNTFGDTPPVVLENQVNYLNDMGYNNITFKKYPGIGHQYTDEMKEDAFAFFSDFKWPSWVYLPVIVHDYAPLALPDQR
jgi:dienelactone hydrolase